MNGASSRISVSPQPINNEISFVNDHLKLLKTDEHKSANTADGMGNRRKLNYVYETIKNIYCTFKSTFLR